MPYLTRFELYAGKRHAGDAGDAAFDHKTGVAAVVQNLKVVLASNERHQWHAVVVDRFYSSVLLAIELLSMGVYVIRTIIQNRLEYDSNVKESRSTRPASISRGTFTFSRSVAHLQIKPQDFAGVVATPTISSQKRKRAPVRHTHAPEQSEDWVTVSGVQKRRQRSCKVCALLQTSITKKSFATTYFCERCSVDDPKCWLCNKIRREYKGVVKTCFEIWHDNFDAGEPSHLPWGSAWSCAGPAKKLARARSPAVSSSFAWTPVTTEVRATTRRTATMSELRVT
ncbi:hypothetical protein BBJ28_00026354 [Nothophytophthora sp. Chile5]|nr:hypothetical protein BBJ28_00026354 [Nothophytophthora sp. Chile5]